MGSLGESTRKSIRGVISNTNFKSELTLTPITVTQGDYGGYGPNTETEGTSVTVDCVPANFIKSLLSNMGVGKVRSGEVRFVIRDDVVLDLTGFDKVTFNEEIFDIMEIRPIPFNEVNAAIIITCSRRLT